MISRFCVQLGLGRTLEMVPVTGHYCEFEYKQIMLDMLEYQVSYITSSDLPDNIQMNP